MSNAVVEPSLASGQLFFSWNEASLAQAHLITRSPSTATRRQPERVDVPARELVECERDENSLPFTQDRISFTADHRIAKPVRIGTVMFKLLKRYGITDQEIEAGLADFARRQ